MASTIKIKNSSTASAVPTSSDLVQGELAVNVTDKRIFTENASGTVVELGTNPSSLTNAGNLTFTGTGNRITGDFSNATVANRALFQTNTVNGATRVGFIPNGTAVATELALQNNADPTNAGLGSFRINSSDLAITSGITGTGTYLPMTFYTGGSERMRVDTSGNLLVGSTSAGGTNSNSCLLIPSGGFFAGQHANGTSSGTLYSVFNYNGSAIGSISQNGTTGVLYNLTSDYRLKNDQQPLTGAKEFVMALQPKKWQWWDGSGEGVGFIAHEFMEVAQYSGHGEKDAVDENGNIIPQSIQPSSSEVMANLVAFIQEQQAMITSQSELITQLQADVAALKGN